MINNHITDVNGVILNIGDYVYWKLSEDFTFNRNDVGIIENIAGCDNIYIEFLSDYRKWYHSHSVGKFNTNLQKMTPEEIFLFKLGQ